MTSTSSGSGPTVALVHGAFADSSSWNEVVALLLAEGTPVQAISNPLRGIAHDAGYVASALSQIPGPVLAVGHSYGGAIITNAAVRAGNVVGLVYVAAFAPDEGETLQDIEAGSTDSVLNTELLRCGTPSARTARRRSSSRSTLTGSTTPSRRTSPRNARGSWRPASGPSPRSGSPSRPGRRPGRPCRPGRSSRRATRRPAAMSSSGWRGGRARSPPRPRDRM